MHKAIDHRHDGADEVEEAEGQVGERRHAERPAHVGAAGIPWDQWRGHRRGVF